MPKRHVIVELLYTKGLAEIALAAEADLDFDLAGVPKIVGVEFDKEFTPTALPGRVERKQSESVYDAAPFDLALEPENSTYIVRAYVDEKQIEKICADKCVVEVFSDPVIEPTIVCPGDAPVGSDADVERLLCTDEMRSNGMDGLGVLIAIVDTGFNLAYLASKGKTPNFDASRSWVPRAGLTPGELPVGHGTMCAFDACIAAPKCTLLDIALLQSTRSGRNIMEGFLSDAVRAYRHLINIMLRPRRPGETRSLIVNNSWGMFHPSWDFDPGHPGNYSDNPNHPFNLMVGNLERAGADILFAAGNCGKDCPDGRCRGVTDDAIYGANGHPLVLCVAGVDITKARVGYSSIGPGRLTRNKPDICGFTHFRGSGVYSADGGTSAATPVVAGVVAAVRTKNPYNPLNPSTHPAAIRSLMTTTAEDLGTAGYDFLHGFGVVDGCELRRRFRPRRPHICRRYPWLCRRIPDICKRFPWLCKRFPWPRPFPPIPRPFPPRKSYSESFMEDLDSVTSEFEEYGEFGAAGEDISEPLEMAYLAGYLDATQGTGEETKFENRGKGGCCCSDKNV